ncbi:hypothetical protein [Zymobacter sp. IVIA_12111.31 C1]|uniref:hypothetical protein n=1 Tax=Zymobacter sp. IVIA_12111.31 C1 TaxID=3394854 RepID=UPI0039C292B3
MTDCNCIDCMHGKPDASAKGISKVSKSRIRDAGIECWQIFAVCEVMEQGLLNSPIAAYSNVENARSAAARNSDSQRSFAVVEVPFVMEASK